MVLPQKVIEQLEREPPKTPGWSGQLLMFSSTIFFISVFVYFGLLYGYKPYLASEVQKLQDKIQAFSQQIPAEDQAKIVNFYSQLINLKGILANHVTASRVFTWFEKNTQANVYYERFDLNTKNSRVSLGGVGKTMEDVNQQFAIFASRPELSRMVIGSVSLGQDGWSFTTELFFDKDYFKEQSRE